jgi:hypothetical protein
MTYQMIDRVITKFKILTIQKICVSNTTFQREKNEIPRISICRLAETRRGEMSNEGEA